MGPTACTAVEPSIVDNTLCLRLVFMTDVEIFTIGLAPEIPEDLYMLIKKVRRISKAFSSRLVIGSDIDLNA